MDLKLTEDELRKLSSRKLFHGEYVATANFKAIEKHASVCFEDGTLVAVTGNADDRESKLYAAMFADTPFMLRKIAKLQNAVKEALVWINNFGEHAPITFGGEQELHDILHDALDAEHTPEQINSIALFLSNGGNGGG